MKYIYVKPTIIFNILLILSSRKPSNTIMRTECYRVPESFTSSNADTTSNEYCLPSNVNPSRNIEISSTTSSPTANKESQIQTEFTPFSTDTTPSSEILESNPGAPEIHNRLVTSPLRSVITSSQLNYIPEIAPMHHGSHGSTMYHIATTSPLQYNTMPSPITHTTISSPQDHTFLLSPLHNSAVTSSLEYTTVSPLRYVTPNKREVSRHTSERNTSLPMAMLRQMSSYVGDCPSTNHTVKRGLASSPASYDELVASVGGGYRTGSDDLNYSTGKKTFSLASRTQGKA